MGLPIIDNRNIEDLIAQLKEMVPYYTPEWRFSREDKDAGAVLLEVFANMFYGNIKRMNKVTEKNFVSFINLLNIKLFTAKSASTFITFELSEGMLEPVYIKAGTSVYALDEATDSQIIFETIYSLLATPSVLRSAYNVSFKQDAIYKAYSNIILEGELYENIPKNVNLFNYGHGKNLQDHCMYINHGYILDVKAPTRLELEFINSRSIFKSNYATNILSDTNYFDWLYYSEGKWLAFDKIFIENNKLVLEKRNSLEIGEVEINERSGRYIKCQFDIKCKNCNDILGDLEFTSVNINSRCFDLEEEGEEKSVGIAPDLLLSNDIPLDISGFYPFGDFFMIYNTLYICSEEVFSKKGANIVVDFKLKYIENRMIFEEEAEINWKYIMNKSEIERKPIYIKKISYITWEYWNGIMWTKLFSDKEYEAIFYLDEEGEKKVKFICPLDIEMTEVNNKNSYWIRARVMQIENMFSLNSIFKSPFIESISMKYDYGDKRLAVEELVTYNNAQYNIHIHSFNKKSEIILPFQTLDSKYPCFYMGFDIPPLKGPISILFDLESKKYPDRKRAVIEWEYLSENEYGVSWKTLKIVDKTNGLTDSGNVILVGPEDFSRKNFFGEDLYWIRIVNLDLKYEDESEMFPPPVIKEMIFNTVEAVQQETVNEEFLQKIEGGINEVYRFWKTPVVYEEIWVDETEFLTKTEIEYMLNDKASDIEIIRGSNGILLKCFVKWTNVDDFFNSTGRDRHYVIDRTMGTITFGDGKYGMQQPTSGINTVKAKYKTGGGIKGNLPAYTIKELMKPIAFIDKVYNPKASDGGSDGETVEEALNRGTDVLKHRNRAVTAMDFECLAKEASKNIARVKCLANYNAEGKKEASSVAIVIVPKYRDKDEALLYFPALKRNVEDYLMDRCPNIIGFKDKLCAILPIYIEVSVSVTLVVKQMDDVFPTEKEALKRLDGFLDTFEGNYDGDGWEIGQYVHESQFIHILKSINSVSYVEKVAISFHKIENGVRNEIRSSEVMELVYGLITNGKHNVVAKI